MDTDQDDREYISIHALLAESDPCGNVHDTRIRISIHALLAESDRAEDVAQPERGDISIHALLAESDRQPGLLAGLPHKFLSTLSLRRATACGACCCHSKVFRSTLSLRRATFRTTTFFRCKDISIHALLAESDHRARHFAAAKSVISIHALLAESDSYTLCRAAQPAAHFYPRSPCGERPNSIFPSGVARKISIHALLAESDDARGNVLSSYIIFLSTLSLRRATLA